MTHPIITDLNFRYTTKKYDASRRIAAEDMDIIKEALRLSASSINSQPWKFIILESDEAKERFYGTFANKYQFNQHHAKEASHIVLVAYDPLYNKEKFMKRIDAEINIGHLPEEMRERRMLGGYSFAEANTDEYGNNGSWTKAQSYLAIGNLLHTLARLRIDSTPMEGVDSELVGKEFATELDGHTCETAVAMGYHLEGEDYNYDLPKARLAMEDVLTVI